MKFIFQGVNLSTTKKDLFILLSCDVQPDPPHKQNKSKIYDWALKFDKNYQMFDSLEKAKEKAKFLNGRFVYVIPEFLYFNV